MAVYIVHEPPAKADLARPEPERFVFVRDGFYFWAFVFGPFWMIRHRLWMVLLLYVIVTACLGIALSTASVGGNVQMGVWFLVAVLVGLEAGTFRRWTLSRRGWKNAGTVIAKNHELAENRFFDGWVARLSAKSALHSAPQPARTPSVPTVSSITAGQMPRASSTPGIVGLFPESGARP